MIEIYFKYRDQNQFYVKSTAYFKITIIIKISLYRLRLFKYILLLKRNLNFFL